MASDSVRSKGDLMLENALLRQQLGVVDRQFKRPCDNDCKYGNRVWAVTEG